MAYRRSLKVVLDTGWKSDRLQHQEVVLENQRHGQLFVNCWHTPTVTSSLRHWSKVDSVPCWQCQRQGQRRVKWLSLCEGLGSREAWSARSLQR